MSNQMMNLNIELPAPLTPPFPERENLATLGHVHFIGIGGAGMSAIARLMLQAGMTVSGSDRSESEALDALRELGATVYVPQAAENITGAQTIVVSTAIKPDNPEYAAAVEAGLPIIHRSAALAATMRDSQTIAVAGTHGKTTTSSMVAVTLDGLGLNPSFAVGSVIAGFDTNAHLGADGANSWFVAEADESDGSFVRYRPRVAVITNAEPDHIDFYETAERVYEAFNRFVASMQPDGILVACADDAGALDLAQRAKSAGISVITYGESSEADVRISGTTSEGIVCSSRLEWQIDVPGLRSEGESQLSLNVPGVHNQLNAAAAFICGLIAGGAPEATLESLTRFAGTDRRFTLRGEIAGIKVFDDYAHHPTEVARALEAGRTVAAGHNLYVLFQPHLFSRTKEFAQDFAESLSMANRAYVMDIYPARELPMEGVTSHLITDAGFSEVHYSSAEDAVRQIAAQALPGDVAMTVGAGNVTEFGPQIVEALKQRFASEA